MELTWIQKEVADKMEHYIVEGSALRGWYTCIKTGKKFRGADAEAQLELQRQAEEAREAELDAAIAGDIEMEEEMDAELIPEVQEKAKKAIEDIAAPKTPAKRSKRKKTLSEVREKYPHVMRIINIELTDADEQDIIDDSMGVIHTKFPAMSEKLTYQTEADVISGKREFILYEIACQHCGNLRVIKPQDAFQVSFCEPCTIEYRKASRRKK